MAKLFSTEAFQRILKSSVIGQNIVYKDVTGSTMDDARKFGVGDPENHPHGTVIMAERQTKARGARDHKWDASNTGNIYVSIILHMPQSFKTFEGKFQLEVAACMAVWSVVRKFGVQAVPKWPNDLWVRGHKLAGFLAEDGRFEIPGSNQCLVILGMGINVNADVRQNPELHSIATSLLCERNGETLSREDFLSDVCSVLEENLFSKSDSLCNFRSHNLFQRGYDISVSCPSENLMIDGEFLEICDNWEAQFIDKGTQEKLQGRSDYYTIRPKVLRKILVMFSSISVSKPASVVSSTLTSLVDTSKHVVYCVPESAIIQSEEWMATCDLIVLAESVCDSARLISKLKIYLKFGGNLLAVGMGSRFAAKKFEIPYKEGVLESLVDNTDFSMVSVQCENGFENGNGNDNSCSLRHLDHIVFPSSLVYFKFNTDRNVPLLPNLSTDTQQADNESGVLCNKNNESQPQKNYPSVKYFQSNGENEDEDSFAILSSFTSYGGNMVLLGFDLGVSTPTHLPVIEEIAEKKDQDLTGVENIVKTLHKDRFKRDKLISEILNVFHVE